jgi:ABC-type arginine transport system ATPase subunit
MYVILLLLELPSDNLLLELLDPRAFQALKILQELKGTEYKDRYTFAYIGTQREDVAAIEMILGDRDYTWKLETFNTKVRLVRA